MEILVDICTISLSLLVISPFVWCAYFNYLDNKYDDEDFDDK